MGIADFCFYSLEQSLMDFGMQYVFWTDIFSEVP